jgi:hypothetical protein
MDEQNGLEPVRYGSPEPPNTYQALTVDRVLLALLACFVLNLFIFYIYRKTFKGVVYAREFNVGLVLLEAQADQLDRHICIPGASSIMRVKER